MHRDIRLKKRKDFKKVYSYGQSFANRELVLYFKSSNQLGYRIGISVSKKVGNAVVRNRIKRLIKEALNAQIKMFGIKKNTDIVIIARNPTVGMSYAQIERSLNHLFRKTKLFER